MDLGFKQDQKSKFLQKLQKQKKEKAGQQKQTQAVKKIQALYRNTKRSQNAIIIKNLKSKLSDLQILFKKLNDQQKLSLSGSLFIKFPIFYQGIFAMNKYNTEVLYTEIQSLTQLLNYQFQQYFNKKQEGNTIMHQINQAIAENQKQKASQLKFYLQKMVYLQLLQLKNPKFNQKIEKQYYLEVSQYLMHLQFFWKNLENQQQQQQQNKEMKIQVEDEQDDKLILNPFYFYQLINQNLLEKILIQNVFLQNNLYEENINEDQFNNNKMQEEKQNNSESYAGIRELINNYIFQEVYYLNKQKKQKMEIEDNQLQKNQQLQMAKDFFKPYENNEQQQEQITFTLLPKCLELKNSVYFILSNNQKWVLKMFQVILRNFSSYQENQTKNKKSASQLQENQFKIFDQQNNNVQEKISYLQKQADIQQKTLINLAQLWQIYISQSEVHNQQDSINIQDIPVFLNQFVESLEKYNQNITYVIEQELGEAEKENQQALVQEEEYLTKYLLQESRDKYEEELYYQCYKDINFSQFFQQDSIKILSQFLSQFVQSAKSEDLQNIFLLSKFYLSVINLKSVSSLRYLIALQSTNDMLENLWSMISKIGTNLQIISMKKQQMGVIIAFFTKLYNQRVEMLDDKEFFNDDEIFQMKMDKLDINSKNFPLEIIKNIGEFLNKYVFELIFLEQIEQLEISKESSIKLLKELFNRDQRKQFLPKDFWVIEKADQNINNNVFFNQFQLHQQQQQQNQILNQQNKGLFQQIINEIPHVFSFEKRHKYFNQLRSQDHIKQGINRDPIQFYYLNNINLLNPNEEDIELNLNHQRVIQVKRGDEFQVGYERMLHQNLKYLYKIQYQNEHGIVEEGIDGGGLQKEFITNIINHGLNPQNGFFEETGDKTLIPNKANKDDIQYYFYIGKIVGKAIYEDILIEPVFSPIFLNQILEKKNNIEELQYLDQNLYKSLMYLKHMKEDISTLSLTFQIDQEYKNPETKEIETKQIELKPDGDKIQVTNENKMEYILLYADYILNQQTSRQIKAFRDGFTQTINQQWLYMFNYEELQLLISGNFQKFDVQDLKQNTVYNGYKENDQTVKDFWEVLQELSIDQKKKFLYFVTSCSRPPTLGFKNLEPKFSIQIAMESYYQQNLDKLPTSSTCMNILKIPNYKNKAKLKEKLIQAINANSGFDLT